jgi:hypothetical protein
MSSEIPTKGDLNHQTSVLDNRDDPFAPREGKTLIWKDVNMTLVCDVLRKYASFSSLFVLTLSGPSETHPLVSPLL